MLDWRARILGGMRLAALALGLTALAACTTAPPLPPDYQPSLVGSYLLDSGDELRVTVFGQADLTNSYLVDKAGYISMPLIGGIAARGRTTAALEGDIAAALKKSYLRNPDVSVEVVTYRPIFVMGEVAAGGQYPYVPGLTVQAAVAIAGGFTPRANRSEVLITRQVNGQVVTIRLGMTAPVQPGDTVNIRERLF